jgi:hypothetical protein
MLYVPPDTGLQACVQRSRPLAKLNRRGSSVAATKEEEEEEEEAAAAQHWLDVVQAGARKLTRELSSV